MRRVRGEHVLFAITLLALTALVAWWIVFMVRSVELEHSAQLDSFRHESVVTALLLGHTIKRPEIGAVGGMDGLEIVPADARQQGDLSSLILPHFPDLAVRPLAPRLDAIRAKAARRRFMVAGEGSLLVLLVGICTVMLYRFTAMERREAARMQEFISTVTHEMKTPLTGIKSLLQTFAAGRVPRGEEAPLFAMGLKEAERLEHMVENVLISGRVRLGGLHVAVEEVQLKAFLERFLDHRRAYLVENPEALRLAWDVSQPDLMVRADPNALKVVLENFVDNAFKYGGDSPVVTLRVTSAGAKATIAVEDRGIGFTPERAESLFVPFGRAADHAHNVQHGTGLGLAIARTLAEKMGGEVGAKSEGPGRGSTFQITITEVAA